jgi:(p)ppGpp synthase/HD superfamily hydrolase
MLCFSDTIDQMVAVLHDSIEDTDIAIDDLAREGYPAEVVTAIDGLTHRADESYKDYIERLAANEVARRVKLADLNENPANYRRSTDADGNAERIARHEAALARLGG